jgi:hypothetical protein
MSDEHDVPHDDAPEGDKKRLFERAIPQLVKRLVERAVESGVEKLQEGPENLRNLVDDLKLPKEVLHYLYNQIDDTKNGLYRVVAKEIRDVLEHTQFADEITKVLTKLSFEIKTEIRFVPNTSAREPRAPDRDPAARTSVRPPSGEPEAEGEEEDQDVDEDGRTRLPRPQVTAHVSMKDKSKEPGRERRRREGT